MANAFMVSTRKGWFLWQRGRKSSPWKMARSAFLGDPVTIALHDPRDGTIYAGLNLGHFGRKLHRSEDGGKQWHEVAAPAYPKEDAKEEGKADAPSVELMWSLESGGADQPGTLWAGTIPGGLFRTKDRGESWELNTALWNHPDRSRWMGGGYPAPGIHSVCVDPRDSRRVLLAVSSGGVWVTGDGGATWNVGGKGLRADYAPPEQAYDPVTQDPHLMVQSPSDPDVLWIQHHNGIFGSTDGAKSWREYKAQPSSFGFAVAVHPGKPATAWFVPAVKDERRYPVDGRMVVTRTDDCGETFRVLHKGLPQKQAYHLIYRHGLDVDEAGDGLVMGSTTGGLWTSGDGGRSWDTLSTDLPPIYAVRFA
jgi:hypothetical protein